MANLIFRITQNELQIPGATSVKNAPLTNAEIDGNFISIKKFITEFDAQYVTQGTLPAGRINDTSHGTRGGGTQHAAVTTTVDGFMIAADKLKLNSIASGAQVNVATNLTYSTATTTGTVNSSTGTNATIPAATTSIAGLLTATDKLKLNGVQESANNYSHPTGGANTTITAGNGIVLSSATVNSLGHVTAIASKTLEAADIPALDAGKITTGTFGTARIPTNISITGSADSLNISNNYRMNSLGIGTAASATTGEIRATNNITAYYSDSRLKTFSGNILNALDKVTQLNGYYFTENDKAKEFGYNNDKLQVGLSAQEVELVLPEIVTAAPFDIAVDENGNEYSKSGEYYKTIYYDKLVPLLIEAIKELKAEVELLKGN